MGGSWASPEQALRYTMWFGDYKEKMHDFAKEHNMKMIGTDMGLIAPPPCDPQPVCQLTEGEGGLLGEAPDPCMVALLTQTCNSYKGRLFSGEGPAASSRAARSGYQGACKEKFAAFLDT